MIAEATDIIALIANNTTNKPVINEKMNQEIKSWTRETESQLKDKAKSLGIVHRVNSPSPKSSVNAITGKTNSKFGTINRVSFKFPRHMVFVHKGLGRDTPVSKAGTTNRKAKEWFEPVTDVQVEKLADIAAENLGDTVVARLHF